MITSRRPATGRPSWNKDPGGSVRDNVLGANGQTRSGQGLQEAPTPFSLGKKLGKGGEERLDPEDVVRRSRWNTLGGQRGRNGGGLERQNVGERRDRWWPGDLVTDVGKAEPWEQARLWPAAPGPSCLHGGRGLAGGGSWVQSRWAGGRTVGRRVGQKLSQVRGPVPEELGTGQRGVERTSGSRQPSSSPGCLAQSWAQEQPARPAARWARRESWALSAGQTGL